MRWFMGCPRMMPGVSSLEPCEKPSSAVIRRERRLAGARSLPAELHAQEETRGPGNRAKWKARQLAFFFTIPKCMYTRMHICTAWTCAAHIQNKVEIKFYQQTLMLYFFCFFFLYALVTFGVHFSSNIKFLAE